MVKHKTMRKRFTTKLHEIKNELRRRMQQAVSHQGSWLRPVVRSYFAYHAIPGKGETLRAFCTEIATLWYKTLRKRGQRNRMTWERMARIVDHWLQQVRILHPWPDQRFDTMTQGKSYVR